MGVVPALIAINSATAILIAHMQVNATILAIRRATKLQSTKKKPSFHKINVGCFQTVWKVHFLINCFSHIYLPEGDVTNAEASYTRTYLCATAYVWQQQKTM